MHQNRTLHCLEQLSNGETRCSTSGTVSRPENNQLEIWVVVVPFVAAGALALISPEPGIFGVIGAIVAVTVFFGYPAFGRSEPISVVPRDVRND